MHTFVRTWSLGETVRRLLCLAITLLALLPGAPPADAQTIAPSRPILFVHGWCGSAWDWAPLFPTILQTLPPSLYPDPTVFYVQYNSLTDTINFWTENVPALGSAGGLTPVDEDVISKGYPNARYFVIQFLDPNVRSTDGVDVTKISILNKAYEISQVIKHITTITQIPQVNILAHSMGGLDARAYVEGMASQGACYLYTNPAVPWYFAPCNPGAAQYANDVANIITIDTPHAGSSLATPNAWLGFLGIEPACQANPSTNMTELLPYVHNGAGLIEALNYDGAALSRVKPSKNPVPIQAIENYFSDVTNSWTGLSGQSDDVVLRTSQTITSDSQTPVANLPANQTNATLTNVPIAYVSIDLNVEVTSSCWQFGEFLFPVLHVMGC